MERQLTLWPRTGPAGAAPRTWMGLDEPQRTRVLDALARLIGKAVQKDRAHPRTEENGHER